MWRKVFKVFVIFLLAGLALEAITLVSDLTANSALKYKNPDSSAFIRSYEWQSGQKVQLHWSPLDNISNNLKRAVLVSEDDTFFEHEGLNIKELKESWALNWKKKKIVRGGSTITMQLIKNLYFSTSKNPFRKLNEMLLALDIERKLSKDRILEIYLNIVEWGKGIYGADNASLHYFNKNSGQLSPSEAAFLAAILPNPVYLTGLGSRRAQFRKWRILRRMSGQELDAGQQTNDQ
jgi:monofunctional glycosyltransferase